MNRNKLFKKTRLIDNINFSSQVSIDLTSDIDFEAVSNTFSLYISVLLKKVRRRVFLVFDVTACSFWCCINIAVCTTTRTAVCNQPAFQNDTSGPRE